MLHAVYMLIFHELFLITGQLQSSFVRRDKWVCTSSVLDIVRSIRQLFTIDPSDRITTNFDRISLDQVWIQELRWKLRFFFPHVSPPLRQSFSGLWNFIWSQIQLIVFKLQMHQVMRMMSLRDICNFGATSKRTLLAAHTDKLWAILYYERCRVPNSILYITDRPGPLRVRTSVGK